MEFAIISTLNGVTYGLMLFMVSAGLTLIFGMMGVLNFAHASFYMLGAYVAYAVSSIFGFWTGILVAPIVVGLVGMAVERFLLPRVHAHGHAHELLLTFGLALIIEELIKIFFGDFPMNYQMPDALRFSAFEIFGTGYPFYRLWLLLTRTRTGIVVRAAERLPKIAEALGHNIPVVFMFVFGTGAALAGLAGAVAGAFYPTNPNMGIELGVIVFVVVVVGGLGSLKGSLVASLLIGLFSSFAVGLDWSIARALDVVGLGDWAHSIGGLMTLELSSVSATIPFALMLIVLLVRPAGLMGERN